MERARGGKALTTVDEWEREEKREGENTSATRRYGLRATTNNINTVSRALLAHQPRVAS